MLRSPLCAVLLASYDPVALRTTSYAVGYVVSVLLASKLMPATENVLPVILTLLMIVLPRLRLLLLVPESNIFPVAASRVMPMVPEASVIFSSLPLRLALPPSSPCHVRPVSTSRMPLSAIAPVLNSRSQSWPRLSAKVRSVEAPTSAPVIDAIRLISCCPRVLSAKLQP